MEWNKQPTTRESQLTILIESFFSLLATARICASWLNRSVEMAVVMFPMVFTGLGFAFELELLDENESEPYRFTKPEFDLKKGELSKIKVKSRTQYEPNSQVPIPSRSPRQSPPSTPESTLIFPPSNTPSLTHIPQVHLCISR